MIALPVDATDADTDERRIGDERDRHCERTRLASVRVESPAKLKLSNQRTSVEHARPKELRVGGDIADGRSVQIAEIAAVFDQEQVIDVAP
jgi:hypothetical protein